MNLHHEPDLAHDYRQSPTFHTVLSAIEQIIKKAGEPVTIRYINERATVPRQWSLLDVLRESTNVLHFLGQPDYYAWFDSAPFHRAWVGELDQFSKRVWKGSRWVR